MKNSDIIDNLKSKINSFTNSQKEVADFILKNTTESAFLSITELAKRVGTSTATIMRMAANLGYSGYIEFQKELQNNLKDQLPQARLKMNLQDMDRGELLLKSTQTQVANITHTLDAVSDEVLEDCVNIILSSNKIYCTGSRMSYTVAYFLNQGLNRLIGNSQLLYQSTGDLPELLLNTSSTDSLIAISFPRYTLITTEIVRIAKQRGSKVISITDGFSSPLAEYSDIIIPCKFDSVGFHNSPLGALFIADYLISAVAYREIDLTNKRLQEVESVLRDMKTHVKKYNN